MTKKSLDGLRVSAWVLLLSSLVIVGFSVYSWWRFLYLSDSRVFWGAIDQSLQTKGVTKTVRSEDETGLRIERSSIGFSPLSSQGYSESRTLNGEVSVSESIALFDRDFARYIEIRPRDGVESFDTSLLQGVWAETTYPSLRESKTLADQITNGLLVFTGNMNAADRSEFVSQLRDTQVFTPTYVRDEVISGKKTQVYMTSVRVSAYNTALKSYLEKIGLKDTATQVGEGGDGAENPSFEIAIEPISRQIVKSGIPSLSSPASTTYTNWGVTRQLEAPQEYISVDELQSRIQSLIPAQK
jgi:hypothetical protein